MNSGWIKLHDNYLNSTLWESYTPEQKVIMITLLLMNEDGKEELITSVSSIQDKVGKGITTAQIKYALLKFKKYNFLTFKTVGKEIAIKIANWDD